MDTIKVTFDAAVVDYTGLYISCRDERPDRATISRPEFLEMFQEQFKFPFTIEMPCGETITYETLKDVPLTNVACPCGDPKHRSVRWEGI